LVNVPKTLFNIEVISLKVLMTSSMIAYTYFLPFVFEFKSNFTYKYFINDVIKKVIGQFCVKSKLDNTHMNTNLEISEFGHINLTLNVHIITF
jgi:hypothetical protein